MSSFYSLSILFFLLLAVAPGKGATVYQKLRNNDRSVKSTVSYTERNLNDVISLDPLSDGTLRSAMFLLQGTEKTLAPNNRQSGSGGKIPSADEQDSSRTDKGGSGSTDTEDAKEEISKNSNEEASAGDSATQSPLDSLFIEIKMPGLGSPLTETVYRERGLVGLFNSCRIDPANPGKQDNTTACYIDNAYNDRLTFSFAFRFPATVLKSRFEINQPSLELIGDSSSIAEPSFLSQTFNNESSSAEISIAYGCKRTSYGTIALQMTFHFGEQKENSTIIRWQKVCLNQQNDQIELGYLLHESGSSELTKQTFPSMESALVVTPNDVSTEIYMKLDMAGARQAFFAPYITSSSPDITPITMRGNHPSGGVLEGLKQTTLQVTYECKTKGVSDISLSIGIPPFENLTAVWKKDCGGRKATNLQVGTSESSNDVVENGNPTAPYMVAIENIGTKHSDAHLHLPGNQSDWTVYIRNSEGDSEHPQASEAALHIGRITLTVERPNTVAVLSPKVSSRGRTGSHWNEELTADHIVAPGGCLKVSFHFLCRAMGESRVLITLPILQYDSLEFGIAKECTHIGTAHKSRELVWTVGNVLRVAVFAVLMLVLIEWWRRRRARTKGFEALPVSER